MASFMSRGYNGIGDISSSVTNVSTSNSVAMASFMSRGYNGVGDISSSVATVFAVIGLVMAFKASPNSDGKLDDKS